MQGALGAEHRPRAEAHRPTCSRFGGEQVEPLQGCARFGAESVPCEMRQHFGRTARGPSQTVLSSVRLHLLCMECFSVRSIRIEQYASMLPWIDCCIEASSSSFSGLRFLLQWDLLYKWTFNHAMIPRGENQTFCQENIGLQSWINFLPSLMKLNWSRVLDLTFSVEIIPWSSRTVDQEGLKRPQGATRK